MLAEILELNHIEWTENGKVYEFIDTEPEDLNRVVNHLVAGVDNTFRSSQQYSRMMSQLKTHTHIMKDGAAYAYECMCDGDGFLWRVVINTTPTIFEEDEE
jgi:hypothetical protein